MTQTESDIPTDLDRINGLLAWWGLPGTLDVSEMEARTKQCLSRVVDLNTLFNQAFSSQAQALWAENEMFACALQKFLTARQPPELMAAQSDLVTGLLENLAAQTKTWAELTQGLHEWCSAMGRDQADEICGSADRDMSVPPPTGARHPARRQARSRAAPG